MRPESKGLAIAALGFVILLIAGPAGIYFGGASQPTTLPIWTGTEFNRSSPADWVAHFTVYGAGIRIVGAWTAFDGVGYPMLIVFDGTLTGNAGYRGFCPNLQRWPERNGTIEVAVDPGPHTIYWGPCPDSGNA